MKRTYRIGGHTVLIDSIYERVHRDCREYESSGRPELVIENTAEDLIRERERTAEVYAKEGRPPRKTPAPDSYIETLATYRRIAEWMPFHDTVLFHGSAVAADGQCYIFAAKSGTGKSTHARLWREMLGERAVMVNDDKPLIHIRADGSAEVFGTPWDGKHHLSTNTCVPLKAICILERAEENAIRPVTKAEALPMLLQQTYRPFDREALGRTLELLDRLETRYYRLACNMDPGAAAVSYEAMRE